MIRNKEWLHYQTRLNCNLLSLQLKEILKQPNLSGISREDFEKVQEKQN
ncbi:MAG: hypothetical protein ACLUTR_00095 [Ruminococcus bicirculans (ex Wegman et al. 2014)]